MISVDALLILPRLRIQNANAISGALTWGFPAPTAFTGFAHALQRKVGNGLAFDGIAIVCHRCDPQASQPAGKRTSVFHLTRNPVGRDGRSAAIVEEGRAHLDISLVMGISGAELYSGASLEDLASHVADVASRMRIAGGSVVPRSRPPEPRELPRIVAWPGTLEDAARLSRRVCRQLLPGFALVSREALLAHHHRGLQQANGDATALDALLDLSRINWEPPGAYGSGDVGTTWKVRRREGWLVPITAGYRALSDVYAPGQVKNARDQETPFRFVEGVYTVGQWMSPHRVDDIRKLFWIHDADPEAGLYRCTTPHFSSVL